MGYLVEQTAPGRLTCLREVAELITGVTPPREQILHGGGSIPLFRPGDLDRPGPLETAKDSVNAPVGRLLPTGAVLLSCIGVLGKVGLLGRPALTNQQITALVPRTGVLPEYIYYWAQTLRPWLRDHCSATTLPIINKRRLGEAPFPLVPLREQHRLVGELAAAEGRYRRALAALADVPMLLERLRRGLLADALSANLTPLVPLREVARMQVGYPFRSDWFAPAGVRLLRGVNVGAGALNWATTAHLPEPLAARYAAYLLRPGDIVLGLDRPVIAAGVRVARVGAADAALLVQRVGRLVLDEPRASSPRPAIDADYLLLCLQSGAFAEHITACATGTQLPHLSPGDVEAALMPLPALEVQKEIVEKTAAAWQRLTGAKIHATAAKQRLVELWQHLLHRAFCGDKPVF